MLKIGKCIFLIEEQNIMDFLIYKINLLNYFTILFPTCQDPMQGNFVKSSLTII